MNIAMISYHTCPLAVLGGKHTGGMNVYVRELTRFLGRVGVHVDVFTRSQDEHVPQVSHDLGYFNRVVHIPAGPETVLPKEQLAQYMSELANGILDFAARKSINYDLIHAHYWMSGVAGASLKEAWQVPMLQMFHTLGLMKQRIGRTPEEREGQYRIKGERYVIEQADRIIAATEAEQSQLESLYDVNHQKISIIPPGVDTHHFYPIPPDEAKEAIGISPDERMALFVGRIEPLKGLDTLIHAMAIVKKKCKAFVCPHYLVIIGGDPEGDTRDMTDEMNRLQNLCAELGLDEIVLFLGKRGQDTLPYYYSAAEVVVMPSHYESFGMVALEAMACGTPVIASRVGGLAYLVREGKTGFFVPAQDPDALAEKLRLIFVNHDLRARLGEQAVVYAHDFSWELITDQIVDVYKKILSS
ncbi:MAG: glycosyltransferase [Chloroflexota bacterium]|jgi:D-inositol-3-phosphate glycosyltransferase|nr:glycosyltransferase [Chloroflexota bacterium]